MSAYVHYEFEESAVAPMNRWAQPGNYTIQVTGGTWDITSTIRRVNQGEVGDYDAFRVINQASGAEAASTGLTNGTYTVANFPADSWNCVKSAGGVGDTLVIRQQGSSGG